MYLTFKVVLRKDGIAVRCVDKVDLLLQPNTLIAAIFLHLHMNPSLQALDAFAEAVFFTQSKVTTIPEIVRMNW